MIEYTKTEFIGQITAVLYCDGLLLYGIGPFLCVNNVLTGNLITKSCVFENSCIHGIKLISKKEDLLELCLWGEANVKVVRVAVNTGTTTATFSKICKDWVLDCLPLIANGNICVTVGMSHCQIETWDIVSNELNNSYKIEEEEGIIYSLSFKIREVDGHMYVAIGNLFNEVHIYSLPNCKLVSKLIGHKGVVFKINWSGSSQDLCTASDDRSIRLWKNVLITSFKEGEEEIEKSSTLILYGHLCRVWDCLLLNKYIISSGEDTQCRVWDIVSGNCLAVLTGHQGKHIRAIAVNKEETLLATGGGDSQIRLWDIEEVVGSKENVSRVIVPITTKKQTIRIIAVLDRSMLISVTDTCLYISDISNSQVVYSKQLNRRYQTILAVIDYIVMGDVDGWITLLDIKNDSIIEARGHTKTVVALFSQSIYENTISFFSSSYDGILAYICFDKENNTLEVKNRFSMNSSANNTKRPSIVYSIDLIISVNLLVVGDSNGKIHLFDISSAVLQLKDNINLPLVSSDNVHKGERVSGILAQDESIYSVGRDGNLCYSKISQVDNNIKIDFVSSCSPHNKFEMIESLVLSNDKQLCTVGFYGPNFIVENTTHNYTVADINCGGFKKLHNFLFLNYDDWIFAYVKDNQIFVNYSQKQSSLFLNRTLEHSQCHGFHINTITLLNSEEDSVKFITGSEDTTMRIFEYDSTREKLQSLITLQGHSGGIKSVCFVKSPFTNEYFIFSGSAFSELKIWKLCCSPKELNFSTSSQYIGGGGLLKCITNISKPKSDMHIRITSLCIIPTKYDKIHCIVCVQSDAKIKIYTWHEITQHYSVIASHSMDSALLCMEHVIVGEDRCGGILFIGANNGKVYVCDISHVLEHASSVVSQKLSLHILSEVVAHQCGINNILVDSLDLWQKTDQICNKNLLITSSDDQTVNVCHFTIVKSENGLNYIQHLSTSKLACNTGITGLQYFGGFIFTCGADQRLNVWDVSRTEEKLDLKYKGGIFIEVPDVSSLLVLPQQDNQFLCFITGYLALQTIKLIKC